jgi:hypothetical protein
MTLSINPAYGRSYSTEEEALEAWNEGLDFRIINGPYLSKRDNAYLIASGYEHVAIFSKAQLVAIINLNNMEEQQ